MPLSLRRVPPNLLVGDGARDYAVEHGMNIMPHDALVTPTARDRWVTWKEELHKAETASSDCASDSGSNIDPDGDLDMEYEEKARQRSRATHVRDMHASIPSYRRRRTSTSRGLRRPAPAVGGLSNNDTTMRSSLARTPPQVHRAAVDRSSSPAIRASSSASPGRLPASSPTPRLGQGHGIYADQLTRLGTIEDNANGTGREDAGDDVDIVWHDGPSDSNPSSPSSLGSSLVLPSASPSPPPNTGSPSSTGNRSRGTKSPAPSTTSSKASVRHPTASLPAATADRSADKDDHITDTVGAIAVDCHGHIAAGSSSGGIGMKHRGRVGPAALVGIGTAVLPEQPGDRQKVCVATVCSGTGEHMATTMAAATCADRLYHSMKKLGGGLVEPCNEHDAMESVIERDFMSKCSVPMSLRGPSGGHCVELQFRSEGLSD